MAENVRLNLDEVSVFHICYKIEKTYAELYRYFSNIYTNNPQVSRLWGKTAVEEDNHADQFKMASRLLGSGIKSLKINVSRANAVLTEVQSVYENVQKSPPSINDALLLAINLENSLSNYHMDSISNFDDMHFAKLFTSMMSSDQDHIQTLKKAYNSLPLS